MKMKKIEMKSCFTIYSLYFDIVGLNQLLTMCNHTSFFSQCDSWGSWKLNRVFVPKIIVVVFRTNNSFINVGCGYSLSSAHVRTFYDVYLER